jgi:hypothetical protein
MPFFFSFRGVRVREAGLRLRETGRSLAPWLSFSNLQNFHNTSLSKKH